MERKRRDANRVLVISGLPAAGKSTVARALQSRLVWPLLAKDPIKERLFDTVGACDAEASRRLSAASYAVMFEHARQLATTRVDFMLEGNFRWSALAESFASLGEHVEFTQVWCTAPVDVLVDRLRHRVTAGSRHPAHPDADNLDALVREISAPAPPLPLRGTTFTLDTSSADADRVLAEIIAFLI